MSVTPAQFAIDAATGDPAVRTVTFPGASAVGDLILIFLGISGGAVTSVIDDLGNWLTKLGDTDIVGTNSHAECWYYLNPVAGTRTITVKIPASSGFATGLSYSSVDQRQPIGLAVPTTITASGSPVSHTISPVRAGKLVTYGFSTGNATSITVTDAGYTVRNATSQYVHCEADIDVPEGSTTTHWSSNGTGTVQWLLWQLVLQERGVPDKTPWGE